MSDKKYQIFVSSTYTDLAEARDKVIKSILSMYHIPIGMEMFSADDDEQWQVIQDIIDNIDYYVLIVGQRYGSVSKDGISYTEKEYDYAKSKGIPIMSFIRKADVATTPAEREHDPKKAKKLEAFIVKAQGSKMCDYWSNIDELAYKLSIALPKAFQRHQRIGWVRADRAASPEIMQELATLSKEKRGLQEELDKLKSSIVQREPIVELKINDGKAIILELKSPITSNKLIQPERLDYNSIEAHLKPYVTKEAIEEYNEKLPSHEVIQNYNLKKEIAVKAEVSGNPIKFTVSNVGTAKAKNIIIKVRFPKEVLVINNDVLREFESARKPHIPTNPLINANRKYEKAQGRQNYLEEIQDFLFANSEQFASLNSIKRINSGIIPNITPSDRWSRLDDDNVITIKINELLHTIRNIFEDEYTIIPKAEGTFNIEYTVICEEYAQLESNTSTLIIKK